MKLWGSSPLARGTQIKNHRWMFMPGLIPARAGNTPSPQGTVRSRWAHPRSRGEHLLLTVNALLAWGSSPLARGTPDWWCQRHCRFGLIPARAGNTQIERGVGFLCGAHPRSRGEHLQVASQTGIPPGSSPLARGTQETITFLNSFRGLIPARAGNTGRCSITQPPIRAHPRSRGEHRAKREVSAMITGSSPLARGAPFGLNESHQPCGLIPARAGSTCTHRHKPIAKGAHPRSRGEHSHPRGGERGVQGSSPLARGARVRGAAGIRWWGLIPARAGSTADVSASPDRQRAHPRSRGEHNNEWRLEGALTGSSPLARGAPVSEELEGIFQGLIPARAGSTGLPLHR